MKRKVNWSRFCKDYHIQMSGKLRLGQWLEVNCPFCRDGGTHGAINIKSNSYNCWRCGKSSIMDFVSCTAGCTNEPREVYKTLDPYFTDASFLDSIYTKKEEEPQEVIIDIKKSDKGLIMPGSSPLGPGCRGYLKKRGFDADYLESKYHLKDGGLGGQFAYRLMIPVIVDGKTVCWQGRHIGNDKIRYKSSSLKEAMNIKDTIYNMDNCKGDTAILTEGVFDCWRIGDGCLCLFGISVKDKQIDLLAERYKNIYVMFDWEKDAQARARECVRKLKHIGCNATLLEVSDTKAEDPGTLSREEVLQIRSEILNDHSGQTPWLIKE